MGGLGNLFANTAHTRPTALHPPPCFASTLTCTPHPPAGTEKGRIVIWDFDTRGIAKVLGCANAPPQQPVPGKSADKQQQQQQEGPGGGASDVVMADGDEAAAGAATAAVVAAAEVDGAPVTALSWSRNARWLMAGSSDGTVCLWDVVAGTKVGGALRSWAGGYRLRRVGGPAKGVNGLPKGYG